MSKKALFINPSIYDFSAFNLWARPIGLLYMASIFKKLNFSIDVIDMLSLDYENDFLQENSNVIRSKQKKYSTYSYFKEEVEKPEQYKNIKRKFFRFGVDTKFLKKLLLCIEKPDIVFVTSHMSYWYKGVFDTINTVKEIFPITPIVLGGNYAKLCYNHAKEKSKATHIFIDNKIDTLITYVSHILDIPWLIEKFNIEFKKDTQVIFQILPYFDCYKNNNFIPLLTSIGCPYSCSYCASKFVSGPFIEKSIDLVQKDLMSYNSIYSIKDIAFYDDALLYNKRQRIIPFLEFIAEKNFNNLNFHTPNAVHIREIDNTVAYLLKNANFKTLRFGFESNINWIQKDSDSKVKNSELIKAITSLKKAGYTKNELAAYILIGLPNQKISEVIETIKFVKSLDITCKLAEFSPIPNTAYYEKAKKIAKIDLDEPLYHNNSVLSLWSPTFSDNAIQELKDMAK